MQSGWERKEQRNAKLWDCPGNSPIATFCQGLASKIFQDPFWQGLQFFLAPGRLAGREPSFASDILDVPGPGS